jgi:hypothetical protein
MNKCLIGTDLMKMIPELKNLMNLVVETIKTMSNDVLKRYETKINENQKHLEQHICNIEVNTTNITLESVRQRVEAQLEECSTTSLDEIIPKNSSRVQFKIQLINPNQKNQKLDHSRNI